MLAVLHYPLARYAIRDITGGVHLFVVVVPLYEYYCCIHCYDRKMRDHCSSKSLQPYSCRI